MNRIIPSTVSIEDLLKELENQSEPSVEKEVVVRHKENSLMNFITEFNIEPGSNKMERRTLYNLYKSWKKVAPLGEKSFYKEMSQYFVQTNSRYFKSRMYFHINQKSLDLSERIVSYLKPTKKPSVKAVPKQKHFQAFIDKFDIKYALKPNNIWVSVNVLYDLYDEWVYEIRKKKPLSYDTFSNFCKLYFPTFKKNKGKVWVSLDDSIKQLIEARTRFQDEKKEGPPQ